MKKPSVYILGASGFMGSMCAGYFRQNGYDVHDARIDVTDLAALADRFKGIKPDAVINFAGVRVEPNIDWCEAHKPETLRVNVGGAINAMLAAIGAGAYPIQISSGCVYTGDESTPFTEEDAPNFFGSYYSRLRIVLQNALAELPVLYARIRMPVSSRSHPRNLIDKLASYKRVISMPNSVTVIEDLMPALEKLVEMRPLGILNLTNEGWVTHGRILEAYRDFVDPGHAYSPISLDELERELVKAKRSNCVLSSAKASSLGIRMPALDDDRLRALMLEHKKSVRK